MIQTAEKDHQEHLLLGKLHTVRFLRALLDALEALTVGVVHSDSHTRHDRSSRWVQGSMQAGACERLAILVDVALEAHDVVSGVHPKVSRDPLEVRDRLDELAA